MNEIRQVILRHHPHKPTSYHNVSADLSKITVNDPARGHHQASAKPRPTDSGHQHDLLFKSKVGRYTKFEPYSPPSHGTWQLYIDPNVPTKSKVRIRPSTTGMLDRFVEEAEQEQPESAEIDPANEEDARRRVSRAIVARRGQRKFRNTLLEAYEEACAVTGSTAVEVLEAAHILPYTGDHRNVVGNGLLLRADIHTLFDLGHIWIEGGEIHIATLLKRTDYGDLEGRRLRVPTKKEDRPITTLLEKHAKDAKDGLLNPKGRLIKKRVSGRT